MNLGDFRRETANLPDSIILDDVMFIQDLPSYYDGRPNEIKDNKVVYTGKDKIRFYMFDPKDWFWDCCEVEKTYDENLIEFMDKFVRGPGIENDRWEDYLGHMRDSFNTSWHSREWQNYRNERLNEKWKK